MHSLGWVKMSNKSSSEHSREIKKISTTRALKMHFQPPKTKIKCVLSIKKKYSEGKLFTKSKSKWFSPPLPLTISLIVKYPLFFWQLPLSLPVLSYHILLGLVLVHFHHLHPITPPDASSPFTPLLSSSFAPQHHPRHFLGLQVEIIIHTLIKMILVPDDLWKHDHYSHQASLFLNGNGAGEGSHVSLYIKVPALIISLITIIKISTIIILVIVTIIFHIMTLIRWLLGSTTPSWSGHSDTPSLSHCSIRSSSSLTTISINTDA